jgi:hypothetical protein
VHRAAEAVLPQLGRLPTIRALLDRTRMVRSLLPFPKHLAIAIGLLGLSVCGLEFSLHLYDACTPNACGYSDRSACAPSWTVHHLLKPDVRISATDPDTGAAVTWRTNSLGLRGGEIDVPKPAGTYRIVCLGDDSTLAPETSQPETFCVRLRETLGPASPMEIEVINAGCPQYGPLLSLLLLKHSLLGLSPDLVICNFDMSDVADDHRCRRSVRMNRSQPLYCPHPDLERQRTAAERMWVERLLMWQHAKHGLACLLGSEDRPEDGRDIDAPQGTYAWLRDDPPDWSVYVDQTLDVIGQMARMCRRSNCQFVLSAVPAPWQISAEAAGGPGVRTRVGVEEHVVYGSRVPFDTLSAFAGKEGILFCDPSGVFGRVQRPERLFRRNAARFSATGHELYARILGRFVVESVAGPWGSGGLHRASPEGRISAAGTRLNPRGLNSEAVRRTGFSREPASNLTEEDNGGRRAPAERRRPPEERRAESVEQSGELPGEAGQAKMGRGETR